MIYVFIFIFNLFLMALAVKMHKETNPNHFGGEGMIFLIRSAMIISFGIAVVCLFGFYFSK